MQNQTPGLAVSLTKYDQVRTQSQTLESTGAYYPLTVSLMTEREPEALNGTRVSLDFFRTLGVTPARGRIFLSEEEQPGGRDVAMVSDSFWHSHFGGDEGLLGRVLTIDGRNVTVVGILPKTFSFPLQVPEPEIWMPRVDEFAALRPEQVRSGATYLGVVGKLRPGATLPAARAELKTIDARYRSQFGSLCGRHEIRIGCGFAPGRSGGNAAAIPVGAPDCGGIRPPDRLRQRRQPAARTRYR